MPDDVRAFLVSSLREMNYAVDALDDATTLGPAGLDLEPLALADLLMRVEERYDIRFSDEEPTEFAQLSFGELTGAVVERVQPAAGSRQR
jgi:acyl carrier protein